MRNEAEAPSELEQSELRNEIIRRLRVELVKKLEETNNSEKDLDEFLEKYVLVARINNVDIVSVNIEHEDIEPSIFINLLISHPSTRCVVMEYFPPEILYHIRNYKKFLSASAVDYEGRIEFADQLLQISEDAEKVVAVADIANKPSYLVYRELFRIFPMLLAPRIGFETNMPLVLSLLAMTYPPINLLQSLSGKGIYNPSIISKYEQLILDFEQARRVYVAKGVKKLSNQYPPFEDDDISQIVLLYPEAHGRRILDLLISQEIKEESSLRRMTNLIYKAFGMTLDFTLRQFKSVPRKNPVDADSNQRKDWQLISEENI